MPETLDALEISEPDDAFLIATEQEQAAPVPPCALVVLVSDHRYEDPADDTHRLVAELLVEAGFLVDAIVRVKSKKSDIRKAIETGVVGGVDLVLTVGGTGVGPRDKTPEATRAVIDKMVPGVGQAIRFSGQSCGAVDAATSRGICGVSGSTVVVNLAASRQAIRDGMSTMHPLVNHLIADLNTCSV
ncbi:molybdenum cofactor biosynthesis protein B [Corynebacterium liangguodongii]|uniref:Molybdenum cofactor biosynthesis protein n=1 Tax=Corynebacterium liangguodongii TaxID=2079535 RepID=A0A2S0WD32_9CORY|nr:MogA/MoaB family molybdenum cofactor biosynthesis protein [Corynebacterium liangguodongii]AWB83671.1 molybdenum cofactor biosynthesis protein [Corynebacterium liangguodongii]PWB99519.1 MogA/MoaB family molybdenum cofactor biosynthesis protein [Corynebacterium liangguodongii]